MQTASSRAQRHSGHNRENQPTLLSRYNFWQALHQKKGRREERETQKEGERVRGDQGQKRCTTKAPLPPFLLLPPIRHSTNPNRYRTHATAAAAAAARLSSARSFTAFIPSSSSLPPSLSLYSLASSGGGERAASLGHSDCLGRPRSFSSSSPLMQCLRGPCMVRIISARRGDLF